MQISVCKLTPELLNDWLEYFDKDAFSDNDEWMMMTGGLSSILY